MQIISEYYSDPPLDRKAIITDENGYTVYLYENAHMIHKKIMTNHSLRFSEDCAENWVTQVFN